MKKQLGFTIELNLIDKLDHYAESTRRTRSQAVETLIDECSIDNIRLIKEQAVKIKSLESELILSKSDNVVLPEIDGGLIEECSRLKKQNEELRNSIQHIKAFATNSNETIDLVINYLSGSLMKY